MRKTDFLTKNCRSGKEIKQLTQVLKSDGTFVVEMYIYVHFMLKQFKIRYQVKSYGIILYHSTLCHGHFVACCYVTRWGKFRGGCCKPTSVTACRFLKLI